ADRAEDDQRRHPHPRTLRILSRVNEDRASRYHRLKRQASIASLLWSISVLGGLLATGSSLAMRTTAESLAARGGASSFPTGAVLIYVVFLTALNEIGGLPIAFYSGFVVERRYGLSTERVLGWLRDQAKAGAIGLVLASGGIG